MQRDKEKMEENGREKIEKITEKHRKKCEATKERKRI